MKIEGAFERFLGQEVLVYTKSVGNASGSVIECVLDEIGEGWVMITQGAENESNISIVNIDNIIRIREYPRNKNGKKKMVFV